ncbi:hypothetical protein SDC9_186767 [bioreactor metagenome]|uniref:Uncharacterized protein n=1 Tax=bioreactor metagenome TaxID=1076179 RepID=A0A645HLX8_9ZZZZ
MPFFGSHARKRARSVDEGNDRNPGPLHHLHQPQSLAIAFGMGTAEIAIDVFLGVAPLLSADHHDRFAVDLGETADNGGVVLVTAIPVKFEKIRADFADVIQRVGTLGMTGELDALPRGQAVIDLALGLFQFVHQHLELFVDIETVVEPQFLPFLDLLFQFGDRLFKFQNHFCHYAFHLLIGMR